MTKTAKKTPEQKRLLEVMQKEKLQRFVDGENVTYRLEGGFQVHATVAENCIKRGWIEGCGDRLFDSWHQTYTISRA